MKLAYRMSLAWLLLTVLGFVGSHRVLRADDGCPETPKIWGPLLIVEALPPFDKEKSERNRGNMTLTFEVTGTDPVLGAAGELRIQGQLSRTHCTVGGTPICVEVFTGRTADKGNPVVFNPPAPNSAFFGYYMAIVVSNCPGDPLLNQQMFKRKETINGVPNRSLDNKWHLEPSPHFGRSIPEQHVPGIGAAGNLDAAELTDTPGFLNMPLPAGHPVGHIVEEWRFETFPQIVLDNTPTYIAAVQWGFKMDLTVPANGDPAVMNSLLDETVRIFCPDDPGFKIREKALDAAER